MRLQRGEFQSKAKVQVGDAKVKDQNIETIFEGLKLPGFRGHFPLCGEGSTNGQETSSRLSLGVPV